MPRQLNIRSDEAFETARRLAERHGWTTTEVVVRALRRMDEAEGQALRPADLSLRQKSLHDRLAELGRKARAASPQATSEHGDLYGDDGAPR
ncbi:type II toxin-antitoxin system VapB family antitoxin [Xanthobacter autotrophicus]|uniref:type II toxin-antitoxin system VapB family antitoxin n=1 Tax=Xanthobacter autotrophicus TaxID=280 RepID=UPI00372BF37C